jgi:hypothetical protein
MGQSLAAEIVAAVADAEGVDPTDLDFALHDHVETDGLRLLSSHEESTWTLTFQLPDHEVTVTSDGVILVDGDAEADWA